MLRTSFYPTTPSEAWSSERRVSAEAHARNPERNPLLPFPRDEGVRAQDPEHSFRHQPGLHCHSALWALGVPWKGAAASELAPTPATWPDTPQAPPPLTVHGHAHGDALLKAAQLALVAGDLIDDTAAVIFAGVGGMQVLLNCAAKEALGWGGEGACCDPDLPFLNSPCSSLGVGG